MKGRRRGEVPTYYWDNYEEMKKIGPRVKIVEGLFTLSEGERESGFFVSDGCQCQPQRRGTNLLFDQLFLKLYEHEENWAERWRGWSRQKIFNVD